MARKSTSTPDEAESDIPRSAGRPARRALAAIGITHLRQLAGFGEKELLALHGVGPKATRIIKAALEEQGLSLESVSRDG